MYAFAKNINLIKGSSLIYYHTALPKILQEIYRGIQYTNPKSEIVKITVFFGAACYLFAKT